MRVLIVEERQGLTLAGYWKGSEYEIPDKHALTYIKRGWAVPSINGHKSLGHAPVNKAHMAAAANK